MTPRLVVEHYENWLLRGSSDDSRLWHADPSDQILLYPSHVGQGYRQNIPLRDDLTLVIMDYRINRDVMFLPHSPTVGAKFEFPLAGGTGQPSRFMAITEAKSLGTLVAHQRIFEIEVIFKGYDAILAYTQACVERLPHQTQQIFEDTIQCFWQFRGGRLGLDLKTILSRLNAYAIQGAYRADADLSFEQILPEALYTQTIDLEYANRLPLTAQMEAPIGRILSCPYQGETRRQYLEKQALELVKLRIQAITHPRLAPADLDSIYQAASILRNRLVTPPTVEALARQVSTNRLKLNQGFHEVYGTTPFKYLRDCRLGLARRLLMTSDRPIETIAAAVGYSSRNHFAKAFRRQTGLNPKVFQMQVQRLAS
ncbi:MAG: AraC family transcriptional regulator [Cyanobacteria bacterium J06626_4]